MYDGQQETCLQSKSYLLYFPQLETSECDTVKHYLQTYSDNTHEHVFILEL
jgi:hypothetical protein